MTLWKFDVPREAAERAAQQRQRLARRHAAAGLVRQRHHAIDVRIVGQRIGAGERVALEIVGDDVGDMRRAVHAGQDADVVARRHPPVGPHDALEGRRRIEIGGRPHVLAIGVVLGEIAHAAVVHMHVLARRDRGEGEADDLAVAADRLAGRVRAHRDLVPGRDAHRGRDTLGHRRAGQQGGAGDHHAVVGMQADHGGRGHGLSPVGQASGLSWRMAVTALRAAIAISPESLAMVTSRNPMPMARTA